MSLVRVLCGVCGQRRVHLLTGWWHPPGPLVPALDHERGLVRIPSAGPLHSMPICSPHCGRWFEVLHNGTVRREDWWLRFVPKRSFAERMEAAKLAELATDLFMANPKMGAEAALARAAEQMAARGRRAA